MVLEMYAPELETAENILEETLVSAFDGEETTEENEPEENEPEENEEAELPEADENDEEAPESADDEAA